MKQTVVQFLEEKLIGHLDISERYKKELFEQAEEMEKVEKIKAQIEILENLRPSVYGIEEKYKDLKKQLKELITFKSEYNGKKKQLTAVEWLVEELKKIGFLTNNIVEFENQVQIAKEMEAKQRQEDKLTGMEEIEKAAEEHADNNAFCEASTDFELQISKRAFISGAKWMLEKLQDFDTWKEWKDINL